VSAQRGIGLSSHLTLFGSKYNRVVHASRIQITVKTKLTRHCAPPRNYGLIAQFEEGTQLARKLYATCIVSLADISFM
jgi:hypothetical protein